MAGYSYSPHAIRLARDYLTSSPEIKSQVNDLIINETELPDEPQQIEEAQSDLMPALPTAARMPATMGVNACPWLDDYISYSRKWAPRAYEHFHEAAGLFLLSTIAARRVGVNLGKVRFTNLYMALVARSNLYTKTTCVDLATELINTVGVAYLLAADNATPQAFIAKMSAGILNNQDPKLRDHELDRFTLAFAGKRGWFYEEFGQHIQAMMRNSGYMADFRGILRRLDDCQGVYENDTIMRGEEIITQPYLSLIANMTPADLKPFAKRSSSLWGDGFLARYALITPPEGERSRERFPKGERKTPDNLVKPLIEWHNRMGMPEVGVADQRDDEQMKTNWLPPKAYPLTILDLSTEVYEAFYAYHDGLGDVLASNENHDLGGNYTRFAEKALRVAVLLASVSGCDRVEMRHWARAQSITERWRSGLHELYRQLNEPEPTEKLQEEERVINAIRQKGKPTVREITQTIRISNADAVMVLDKLIKAEVVEALPGGRTTRFQLIL